jgi:hypothetical protein
MKVKRAMGVGQFPYGVKVKIGKSLAKEGAVQVYARR